MTILEKLGHQDLVSQIALINIPSIYTKTSITQPSDCLCTWVRPCSMWNMMLKTLDYFFVSLDMIWGTWAQFPQITLMCISTCKTGIIQPSEGLDNRLKANLMWNLEPKTFDYFLCVPAWELAYCPNSWVPVKQV